MQQEETKDSNKGTFIVEPVVLEELNTMFNTFRVRFQNK